MNGKETHRRILDFEQRSNDLATVCFEHLNFRLSPCLRASVIILGIPNSNQIGTL
jgi:hypothetical protein